MNGKIRILIADDHALVRMGIASLLSSESDFDVVGEAKNGEEAVKLTASLEPDVILMDLMMPKMDGVKATTAILAKDPNAKIIILTSFAASDGIAHALSAGALGVVMKDQPNGRLIAAIRKVAAGQKAISGEVERQLAANPPVPSLSPRQREVLTSITEGLTNREIAHRLGISVPSVEEHVNALLAKIGAANRTEAVAIALKKQLLKI